MFPRLLRSLAPTAVLLIAVWVGTPDAAAQGAMKSVHGDWQSKRTASMIDQQLGPLHQTPSSFWLTPRRPAATTYGSGREGVRCNARPYRYPLANGTSAIPTAVRANP